MSNEKGGILGTGISFKQALVVMAILAGGFGGGALGGDLAHESDLKALGSLGQEVSVSENRLAELAAKVAVLEARLEILESK